MKKQILLGLAVLAISSAPAFAHKHRSHSHHHPFHGSHHRHYSGRHTHGAGSGLSSSGRPSAWCGFQMRIWLGVKDVAYNLAANWAHWGHAATAGIGAVVVYPHHVAQIVGPCHDGGCVMRSGNDGHAVRMRWRKLAGNIGIRQQ